MNPNDKIRAQVLRWFYDRNANATSQYGKRGSAAKISDVKKGLKEVHGLRQQDVVSNLTYLIDKGWINRVEIEKTIVVKGGTVPSTVTWYEISSAGIDKIEGQSEFQNVPRYSGINVQATGMNIITLGDGNIVNARFRELHNNLSELKQEVAMSETLSESQKLNTAVDIETIRDQLAKQEPDPLIVDNRSGGLLRVRLSLLRIIGELQQEGLEAVVDDFRQLTDHVFDRSEGHLTGTEFGELISVDPSESERSLCILVHGAQLLGLCIIDVRWRRLDRM